MQDDHGLIGVEGVEAGIFMAPAGPLCDPGQDGAKGVIEKGLAWNWYRPGRQQLNRVLLRKGLRDALESKVRWVVESPGDQGGKKYPGVEADPDEGEAHRHGKILPSP